MNREETKSSLKKGFNTSFSVGGRYYFVDINEEFTYADRKIPEGLNPKRLLIQEGNPDRVFFPANLPQLPNLLARTNPEKESEILKFIERYGELGGKKLFPQIDFTGKRNFQSEREPLEWIIWHIKIVQLILELLSSIQRLDEKRIIKLIREFPYYREEIGWSYLSYPSLGEKQELKFGEPLFEEPIKLAAYIIRLVINRNISSITREISWNFPNFKTYYNAETLIENIYWHLANNTEGGEFRTCELCHTPFLVIDNRQRFCPYDPNFEKESRCAMAYRQKQRRDKLSKQEGVNKNGRTRKY